MIYPALATEEEASVARRILRSDLRGAVVGVKLRTDSRAVVYRFMNELRLCTRAASVGDLFTGVVHPATATHREMSAAKRARLGITEGLLRVSAGIEDAADIIGDIEQAFARTEEFSDGRTQMNTEERDCLKSAVANGRAAAGSLF